MLKVELTVDEVLLLIGLVENKIEEDEEYVQKYGNECFPSGKTIVDEINMYKNILEKLHKGDE